MYMCVWRRWEEVEGGAGQCTCVCGGAGKKWRGGRGNVHVCVEALGRSGGGGGAMYMCVWRRWEEVEGVAGQCTCVCGGAGKKWRGWRGNVHVCVEALGRSGGGGGAMYMCVWRRWEEVEG